MRKAWRCSGTPRPPKPGGGCAGAGLVLCCFSISSARASPQQPDAEERTGMRANITPRKGAGTGGRKWPCPSRPPPRASRPPTPGRRGVGAAAQGTPSPRLHRPLPLPRNEAAPARTDDQMHRAAAGRAAKPAGHTRAGHGPSRGRSGPPARRAPARPAHCWLRCRPGPAAHAARPRREQATLPPRRLSGGFCEGGFPRRGTSFHGRDSRVTRSPPCLSALQHWPRRAPASLQAPVHV